MPEMGRRNSTDANPSNPLHRMHRPGEVREHEVLAERRAAGEHRRVRDAGDRLDRTRGEVDGADQPGMACGIDDVVHEHEALVQDPLGGLAIITVLAAWNNLLWPLVVTSRAENRTLSVGIASLNGQYVIDYPVMMAASLMAMAPILILFIILQRQVIEGLAHSGLKG